MQAILTSIVAVAGTLLGSVVTYVFQRQAARRAEAFSFRLQLRKERMIAYSDFAQTLTEYARVSADWWHLYGKYDYPGSGADSDFRDKYNKIGGDCYNQACRVQLVSNDQELVDTAWKGYRITLQIRNSSTEDELDACSSEAGKILSSFIKIASLDVQAIPVLP